MLPEKQNLDDANDLSMIGPDIGPVMALMGLTVAASALIPAAVRSTHKYARFLSRYAENPRIKQYASRVSSYLGNVDKRIKGKYRGGFIGSLFGADTARKGPLEGWRGKFMKNLGVENAVLSGPFMQDLRSFAPLMTTHANGFTAGAWNKALRKMFGSNKIINKGEMMYTVGAMPIFSMFGIQQAAKEYGLGGAIMAGIAEPLTFASYRLGEAAGSALGYGLGGALGSRIAGVGLGAVSALLPMAIFSTLGRMSSLGRKWSTPDFGGNVQDNSYSYTMRQRSLNAIRTSMFNIRAELGNEAIRLAGLS